MSLLSVENLPDTEAVAVVAETSQAERIAWCNELHTQVHSALARAWQTSVVLGYELTKWKERLPHGEFGKLFSDENDSKYEPWFTFGYRQGAKYMDLYRKCVSKAELLNVEDEMHALLEEFSAARTAESAERLTLTFGKIAPEATSMRQALLEFMRTEPEFTKRNDKGQIKALPDAAAQVKAATLELEGHVRKLNELLESGRYTLAEAQVRADMEAVCRAFAQKLSLVR